MFQLSLTGIESPGNLYQPVHSSHMGMNKKSDKNSVYQAFPGKYIPDYSLH